METNMEARCLEKEKELLGKYFGNLAEEAAQCRQDIGCYTPDLPLKIAAEFHSCLEEFWREYSDEPLILEERELLKHMTEDDREAIGGAYADAETVTLWERITRSNHEDVAYYKGLLHEYTKDLLMVMRHDFLEEITGKHINCKAFED